MTELGYRTFRSFQHEKKILGENSHGAVVGPRAFTSIDFDVTMRQA